MRFLKSNNHYIIVLEKDEYVIESLKKFAASSEAPRSGFFFGIGAVRNPKIGYFDLQDNNYAIKKLEGEFEVINITGNIGVDESNEIIVHAHICLGDKNYNVFGGHLFEAQISVTMELIFIPTSTISRKTDSATGLKLIRLSR